MEATYLVMKPAAKIIRVFVSSSLSSEAAECKEPAKPEAGMLQTSALGTPATPEACATTKKEARRPRSRSFTCTTDRKLAKDMEAKAADMTIMTVTPSRFA